MILWDLVGSCNLRCPSCPVGNMPEHAQRGLIDPELFQQILQKLASEFRCRQLHFYNWTEPLIHPQIVEFCRHAAEVGFHVHLSSNLNHLKDAEGLLNAGVKTFRISLSGFTQPVYERGHRGGNVASVKRNMQRLAETKQRTASRTRVHVYYHKYLHNLHELAAMESFALKLGFEFLADWAFLMPLEKLLAYKEGTLASIDRDFADASLAPSPGAALQAVQPFRGRPCELIEQLVLDFRGNVALCCAVYDRQTNFIGSYLDMSWPELQRMKYAHATCTACTNVGGHVLYTHYADASLRARMAQLAEVHAASASQAAGRPLALSLPVLPHTALARSA